ncbi:MAG TPA: putative quinol monooxygenase [Blastocatellia bacterium]|nr:putative quinol monooxygenase [Blastocatellia bacterium]HMX26306.1 putative quinol monooxygenase [Blastocatellia bacterium]HMY71160.1 putative quinol monooxygenase [Blastocatellia bacterium]HMZ20816.1 putative quinol monooxygenase [Blastocatellia bacterium]HNG31665.1 putative quinol monooxygenase [Blastocatellia bacterium]
MNQEKVTVIAHIEVKPGAEEAFIQHAHTVVAATRAEAACINYDLHQSADDSTKFVFYENWTSLAGLDQHAKSAHIQTFRAGITDLIAKPVDIQIWKMVTESAG